VSLADEQPNIHAFYRRNESAIKLNSRNHDQSDRLRGRAPDPELIFIDSSGDASQTLGFGERSLLFS